MSNACPLCGEELWHYDWYRICPDCQMRLPDWPEDRERQARDDDWGLYAFYGHLEELIGRRVVPQPRDRSPGFAAEDVVEVTDVHPPNSVRIGFRDGGSVGLRGLSDLLLF